MPPPGPSIQAGSLSSRESEVLRLVASGQSSKDISLKFGVSIRTVKTYRERIMRKLNLHSIAELTAMAVRHGFVVVDEPETQPVQDTQAPQN